MNVYLQKDTSHIQIVKSLRYEEEKKEKKNRLLSTHAVVFSISLPALLLPRALRQAT